MGDPRYAMSWFGQSEDTTQLGEVFLLSSGDCREAASVRGWVTVERLLQSVDGGRG